MKLLWVVVIALIVYYLVLPIIAGGLFFADYATIRNVTGN
jgi:hypothetical protein